MPLHRLIPDEELPPELQRPLKFGDPEQIRALRLIDEQLAAQGAGDDIKTKLAEGKFKKYRVTFRIENMVDVVVYATSAKMAANKAEFEMDDEDFLHGAYKHVSVEEINIK